MPRVTFVTTDGERRDFDVAEGQTILDIAHRNGIDLEGACEGALACSTCHVIVDPAFYDRLGEPPRTKRTCSTSPSG